MVGVISNKHETQLSTHIDIEIENSIQIKSIVKS